MQIILLEQVANLGVLGDVVNVKNGYARNFLIPQGKAKRATEANLKEFEARRAELEAKQAEILADAKARAEKLVDASFTIAQKAGVDGRLFGSVTNVDIAEAITAAGVAVKRFEVRLPNGPLKAIGLTTSAKSRLRAAFCFWCAVAVEALAGRAIPACVAHQAWRAWMAGRPPHVAPHKASVLFLKDFPAVMADNVYTLLENHHGNPDCAVCGLLPADAAGRRPASAKRTRWSSKQPRIAGLCRFWWRALGSLAACGQAGLFQPQTHLQAVAVLPGLVGVACQQRLLLEAQFTIQRNGRRVAGKRGQLHAAVGLIIAYLLHHGR